MLRNVTVSSVATRESANSSPSLPAETRFMGCLAHPFGFEIGLLCMSNGIETIGIIAGNRSLPMVFARQARKGGIKRLVAVGFEGETDPSLASLVDEMVWLKVGQLSKLITALVSRGVKHCIMAGQIAPRNL